MGVGVGLGLGVGVGLGVAVGVAVAVGAGVVAVAVGVADDAGLEQPATTARMTTVHHHPRADRPITSLRGDV
jgi:hypothetical protein